MSLVMLPTDVKVRNEPRAKFPPGTYYVGDLNYVMKSRWKEVCEITTDPDDPDNVLDGAFVLGDAVVIWMHQTMYGDGEYWDKALREYGVDSGSIGVCHADYIDDVEMTEGGHLIQFDESFIPVYVDGKFRIGHVHIDTR